MNLFLAVVIAVIVSLFSTTAYADQYLETMRIFNKAPAVQPFFKNAYGYAVFPFVGKGGFVIGGAYGEGKVYKKGTYKGTTTLVKFSIGFQLGGQAFSEIIFFRDKKAYEKFISGSFEFDASASAVVVTLGAQATAGTHGATAGASVTPDVAAQADTSYTYGFAVFVYTKGGLMYEASMGGQKFSFTPE
ncbi:MAG: lipid-binding SYLF domain-containing protein [Desulfobacteraceae bacterium]|nr:lipid-binding SYLF domain-containing protein [Desulfobacteraceae bacterium]